MTWRKATVLVPAALVILVGLLLMAVGINMVVSYPPNHHDFKEGLMLLIPSVVGIGIVLLITKGLLKNEWVQNKGPGDLCCPDCGYNMAGLSSTKCPECGAQFTIDQLRQN